MSRVGKSTETECKVVVTRGWREGVGRKWGVTVNGCGVSFWDNENILEREVIATQHCEWTTCH